jgi:hypothetical protein
VFGTGSYKYWNSELGEYETTDSSAEDQVYWNNYHEEWQIPGSMNWFIKKVSIDPHVVLGI